MLANYLVPYSGFGRGVQRRLRGGRPFGTFHRDIEDLFERAFGGAGLPAKEADEPRATRRATSLSPRVNVVEGDGDYTVTAELPGLDERELKVELNDGHLTIEGEKKAERDDEAGDLPNNFHLVERSFGTFKRTFRVPTDVNVDGIDASFKNGVLTVSLPKKEEAKKTVKKIAVKAN